MANDLRDDVLHLSANQQGAHIFGSYVMIVVKYCSERKLHDEADT